MLFHLKRSVITLIFQKIRDRKIKLYPFGEPHWRQYIYVFRIRYFFLINTKLFLILILVALPCIFFIFNTMNPTIFFCLHIQLFFYRRPSKNNHSTNAVLQLQKFFKFFDKIPVSRLFCPSTERLPQISRTLNIPLFENFYFVVEFVTSSEDLRG